MNSDKKTLSLALLLKISLPVLILVGTIGGAVWLIGHKTKADEAAVKKIPHAVPEVSVVAARQEALRMDVASQGVVTPKIEIDLVPEVSGKVVKAHPNFAPGGYVKKGEVLLAIDPRDYEFAVTRAHALVAEAYKELLREREEALQAESEWQALGSGKATDYVLHKPQLKEREAKLAAAQADVNAAKLQVQRCRLFAPFSGWVRDHRILPGQYLTAGTKIARLYADDSAEVKLPIAAEQMPHLTLPTHGQGATGWPQVQFTLHNGKQELHWQGRLVRTSSDLDDKTATFYAVAEIPNAFAANDQLAPLLPGTFVQAAISGKERYDLFSLPKSALFGGNQVYSVSKEGRLKVHKVDIIRADKDRVIVDSGIAASDQILTDGVELPIDGMRVKIKTSPSTSIAISSAKPEAGKQD